MINTDQVKYPVVILFGPPGSGKGTQANAICEELSLHNLSIGNSIRSFVKSHDEPDSADFELAKKLKLKLESGELQDFADVKYIVENEINETISNHRNILIEGMPRTVEQAKWLSDFFTNSKVDCLLFHFILNEDQVIERLSHRYYAPGSETPYSSYEIALANCKPNTLPIRRHDDEDSNIIKHRYNVQYADCQAEIINTFKTNNCVTLIDIDASPSPSIIFESLSTHIKKFAKQFITR